MDEAFVTLSDMNFDKCISASLEVDREELGSSLKVRLGPGPWKLDGQPFIKIKLTQSFCRRVLSRTNASSALHVELARRYPCLDTARTLQSRFP